MSVQKTTVYLDTNAYRKIKAIAKVERRNPADLIREAVTAYAEGRATRTIPRSIGSGNSGIPDLGERVDEFLADGFGQSK
jgi:Ribbon-helix-helix protein, copG family